MKRLSIAVLLLLATVSCLEEEKEGPCGGCSSPHPYTYTTGGPTSSVSGSADVLYEHGKITLHCGGDTTCAWSDSQIVITAELPREWSVPDAGADASDASDAGDASDADADADFPDATTGSPRGWGSGGRIVIIDLGSTRFERSSPLVGARIITCGNRHETLVTTQDGAFMCASASQRAARIVPIEGELRIATSVAGETSTIVKHVEARTRSGSKMEFERTDTNTPYESHTSENCY